MTPLSAAEAPRAGRRPRSRLYILLVLTALNAFNHLDRQLVAILLEPIRREFGLGDIQLGLLSGPVFAILFSLLGFPAAVWATRRRRIPLITVAAIVWGATTAACGLARTFGQLLLGRLGVGIGEAGATPAAQAVISDLYAPGVRTTAMSIYTAGLNAGVVLAFLVGGFVGQVYGWRQTFVVAGLATVVAGLLLRLTVREPPRGRNETTVPAPSARALVGETLRQIAADPALRHLCAGATLTAIVAYGVLAWLPSFLVRAHGLQLAQAGFFLALVVGIGGAAGNAIGGAVSDRLRARDIRWSLWLVAAVLLAAKPLAIGAYLAAGTPLALALLVLPGVTGSLFLGPSFAVLHDRVEAALRPVATAVLLGLLNLIGVGLGPLLVGVLSDTIFAGAGPRALGCALAALQVLGVWGAAHYYLAGRRLAPLPAR